MHNFSKISWGMQKFFFPIPQRLWPAQKLSHQELVCPGRILNLGEFLLLFFLDDFEIVDEIIFWIILFLFYCFCIIKNLRKVDAAMHKSYIYYLSNYGLWIYFLFLHVKVKTVQKSVSLAVSIILGRVFMPLWNLSQRFYINAVVKPIPKILYHFQKRCVVKAIRYENRAKLFVLNGN